MPASEYWDGDSTLVKEYKAAYEISVERKNTMAWLQGRYVYDALCNVSPILHAFSSKGTKPMPYRSEPYPITKNEQKAAAEREEKAAYEKKKAKMQSIMVAVNRRFSQQKTG